MLSVFGQDTVTLSVPFFKAINTARLFLSCSDDVGFDE